MKVVGLVSVDVLSRDVSAKTILKDIKHLILVPLKRSLQLISEKHAETMVEFPQRKLYESPHLRKLTLEQARLLVVEHVDLGDSAACEFDRILFQEQTQLPRKA